MLPLKKSFLRALGLRNTSDTVKATLGHTTCDIFSGVSLSRAKPEEAVPTGEMVIITSREEPAEAVIKIQSFHTLREKLDDEGFVKALERSEGQSIESLTGSMEAYESMDDLHVYQYELVSPIYHRCVPNWYHYVGR